MQDLPGVRPSDITIDENGKVVITNKLYLQALRKRLAEWTITGSPDEVGFLDNCDCTNNGNCEPGFEKIGGLDKIFVRVPGERFER